MVVDVHTRPHLYLRGTEDSHVDHQDNRADALDEVFTALNSAEKKANLVLFLAQGINNCCPGLCCLIVGEHKISDVIII